EAVGLESAVRRADGEALEEALHRNLGIHGEVRALEELRGGEVLGVEHGLRLEASLRLCERRPSAREYQDRSHQCRNGCSQRKCPPSQENAWPAAGAPRTAVTAAETQIASHSRVVPTEIPGWAGK